MILTDPQAIACEQEVQRYDPTIFLLRNDRLKTWVVAQDMRKTHGSHNPWVPCAFALEGVIGIGDKQMTNWNYLFEVEVPNAQFIIRKLAENSVRLSEKVTGKSRIEAMRAERKRLEDEQHARNMVPVREMAKDLWTYGVKGKKSVLISR